MGENYKDMRMFVNIVSLLKQIGIEDGTERRFKAFRIYLVNLITVGRPY